MKAVIVFAVINLLTVDGHLLPRNQMPLEVKRPSPGLVPGRPCSPLPLEVLWQKLETTTHSSVDRFRSPVGLPLVPPESVVGTGPRTRRRSISTETGSDVVRSAADHLNADESRSSRQMSSVVTPPQSSSSSTSRRLRTRPSPKPKRTPTTNATKARDPQQEIAVAAQTTTSWICRLETEWKRMEEGVFPPLIETGRCTQTTCMMGLYSCTPRLFAVRVLRRVPDQCNPLPSTSHSNTTYEEVWAFDEYHVTVGCECSKRRATGIFTHKPPNRKKPGNNQ